MGLHRGIDGSEPVRSGPVGHVDVDPRVARVGTLGSGTVACPACDAPVAIGPVPMRPHQPLSCPYCGRRGALREFLSLAAPTRPARVEVRLCFRPSRSPSL
jgi:uncharacterized Zn-finger protein